MNPTDVEAVLREMYTAKGDSITEATVSQQSPPRGQGPAVADRSGRSHLRWLGPLVAAAAVIALAVGLNVTSHSRAPQLKPTPVPPAITRSVIGLPAGPGRALKHGEVGQRTEVPWRSVGRGWTLATWSTGKTSTMTVFLVNPVGGRYTIATIPSAQPVAWSSDVRDVVLTDYSAGVVTDLDVVTGTVRTIPSHQNVFVLGVLPGANFGVLGSSQKPNGGATSFGILGPDGTIAKEFPTSAPGAGAISVNPTPTLIATPDGHLVLSGDTGIALVTAAGDVDRVLALPSGITSCGADDMWSATTLVASCFNGQRNAGAFLIPLDGGAATRLSLAAPPAGFGAVQEAWPVGGKTLVTLEAPCGPPGVMIMDSDGTHSQFGIPLAPGAIGVVEPLQTSGSTIFAVTTGDLGCQGGGSSLVTYDVHTHQTAVFLGPGLNGGSIGGALAWPGQ